MTLCGFWGDDMRIRAIHLKGFKRFTDLKIKNLAPTVKLVVLLGPNGCGKSSLFDAFLAKSHHYARKGYGFDPDYHYYKASIKSFSDPIIEFHNTSSNSIPEEAIYVRTAYRNEPDVHVNSISAQQPVLTERRFTHMTQNDASTNINYSRLISNALDRSFRKENRQKTLGEYQDETLGEIQEAMGRLFPDLSLNSLGNPLNDKTFTFNKGKSANFPYKNLSGGEKSAFDLLLDIFVKREQFNNTVFCIDEPEAHMNPKLQGSLLEEIFHLINDNSQLWIATHAIGMMRKAWDLYEKNPGEVVFLDFGQEKNFDDSQVITPTTPSREFWEQTHKVALDDLGELIVPKKIIICEGRRGDGFDAECYNRIFSRQFPDAKFISAGGKGELKNYIPVIRAVAKGVEVSELRDRDNATGNEIKQMAKEGIKVLQRRAIEDYLLDDEVLLALRKELKLADEEKINTLIRLRKDHMDAKGASQQILQKLQEWGVPNIGSNRESFLRDTIAPLIQPGMLVYEELKTIIFGNNNAPTP